MKFDISPSDVAQYDQTCAAYQDALQHLVDHHRMLTAGYGDLVATVGLVAARVDGQYDAPKLASLVATAVRQLAVTE